MRLQRIAGGVIVLTALAGVLAACGDDSDEPVALTVKASSSGDTYAFDIPDEIDGGVVALTLDNVDSEPHEIALVHVEDGTTPDEVVSELLATEGAPIPDFVLGAGGVGFAAPDQKVKATQDLEPGSYVYFCTFGEDDAIHYDNGMLGAVEVKGDKGKGDLPESTESITASEYTFEAEGLTAGTHQLLFKNDGPDQLHHAQLFPMTEGSTIDDVKAFLATEGEPTGPPPLDFEGGVGTIVLAPGQEQVVDVTLQKGSYAAVCFITDREGGPPHFVKGMVSELTVE